MSAAAVAPEIEIFRSPLAGVADAAWTHFVAVMAEPEHAHAANETGHLGLFLFAPARLALLGYAENVRYAPGPAGRVAAANYKQWPLEEFLARPTLQYRIFAESCAAYFPRLPAPPAAPVAGAMVTVSGLLAVAHRAGLKGLKMWLKSPADRETHPFTTDAFERANGTF